MRISLMFFECYRNIPEAGLPEECLRVHSRTTRSWRYLTCETRKVSSTIYEKLFRQSSPRHNLLHTSKQQPRDAMVNDLVRTNA